MRLFVERIRKKAIFLTEREESATCDTIRFFVRYKTSSIGIIIVATDTITRVRSFESFVTVHVTRQLRVCE